MCPVLLWWSVCMPLSLDSGELASWAELYDTASNIHLFTIFIHLQLI